MIPPGTPQRAMEYSLSIESQALVVRRAGSHTPTHMATAINKPCQDMGKCPRVTRMGSIVRFLSFVFLPLLTALSA